MPTENIIIALYIYTDGNLNLHPEEDDIFKSIT